MDTFYIITNYQKDPEMTVAHEIREYLESKGKMCYIQQREAEDPQGRYRYTDAQHVSDEVECVLVLGGDGTLLQAARDLVDRSIPLLGINMGTLGYLAEIDRKNIFPALDKLIGGEYTVEHRMMLTGTAFHQSRRMLADIALNDIVISRNGRPRVVDFNVYVDGAFLSSYTADGIIISTPTGSTGYNLSAGGPILEPSADILVITPICSHSLNTKSIVLSAENHIEIEIGEPRHKGVEQASVSFDAKECIPLVTGDRIRIKKTGESVVFLKLNKESFMRTMCRKMKGN